tara:strand:+ start:25285 stop:25668 length:384 start_codon:yes stop_codon:yes gene_type:complete
MNHSFQRQISPRIGFLLLFIAVVPPFLLSYLMADRSYLVVPLLVVPLILMAVWSDLGFLLGSLSFWGTLLVMTWGTVEEGQVDNPLPGIAAVLGLGFYVLFYGPVFLLMKSSDRFKAKWLGKSSDGA